MEHASATSRQRSLSNGTGGITGQMEHITGVTRPEIFQNYNLINFTPDK